MGSEMVAHPTLEGMRHIVALSYNHLPHELKGCVMYLSIFPEDYVIDKNRLLSRWIAEGLVPEKRGWTPMEVAESYLDELVSRNIVIPRFGFDGKVESCQVHDVLLEVMVSKSLDSNFVSLLGEQYEGKSYDRIRRLSIQAAATDSCSHGITKHSMDDVQHVRSLSVFNLPEEHRLLDNLDKFVLLRVLDLEDCKGLTNKHVLCACRLYLLRFLSLKKTDVDEVPPEVRRLQHLQVLNLQGTKIAEPKDNKYYCGLSDGVTNLQKLERLQFSGSQYMHHKWALPKGIEKMKALREVGIVRLDNDVEIARGLGELEHLEDIWICIAKNVSDDVVQEFARSLCKMQSLRRFFVSDDGWEDMLKFLHELKTPPRLLRHMRIGGVVGPTLPAWIGQLTHLVEFRMSWARLKGDELFGVLCKLPSLKRIQVEEFCYVGHALVARTAHRFPSLVSLEVSAHRYEDPRELHFEEGSMPKLQLLAIDMVPRDDGAEMETRSIVGIEHLTSLHEVRLTGVKTSIGLDHALKQVKAENSKRIGSGQFQVVVKYE
ncbi:unnamed protein product [Urochloa humidicola]